MTQFTMLAQASAQQGTAPQSPGTGLASVPGEIEALPFLQHLGQVLPAADVAFGGTMLILIILIHAAGVRLVTDLVARRMRVIMAHPRVWQADVVMSSAVVLLLVLHLVEIVVWSSSLVYGGLVSSWRAAGFFAGNTYTTVGYGTFVLPPNWEMVAPIIAMSGLFTFGWSGSLLVDIVARCQRVKDAALRRPPGRVEDAHPQPPDPGASRVPLD